MDAGFDGGTPDGGVDAPPIDAPVDAGPDDGGIDAPIDAPVIDVPVVDVFDAGFDAGPGGLIFSEYVEGSSNNKALEVFNASGTSIDLSVCRVERYQNGDSVASATYSFAVGTLAAGAAFVLCHPSFSAPASCDDSPSGPFVNHNGDDAYGLFCSDTLIDSFGQIGVDPGTEWSGGGVSTQDSTLRRKCTVVSGDMMGSDAFDPSIEWGAFPVDTFSDLGIRTCP